jgi:hypothetical protein
MLYLVERFHVLLGEGYDFLSLLIFRCEDRSSWIACRLTQGGAC